MMLIAIAWLAGTAIFLEMVLRAPVWTDPRFPD